MSQGSEVGCAVGASMTSSSFAATSSCDGSADRLSLEGWFTAKRLAALAFALDFFDMLGALLPLSVWKP